MRPIAVVAAILLAISSLFPASPQHALKKHAPKEKPLVLDVNRASAEDFQKLPGIGPELARRIVRYRQQHGPFRRVEDLIAVRGIGHKKWRKLRPYLQVNSPAGESRPKD
jgi:comEA protein